MDIREVIAYAAGTAFVVAVTAAIVAAVILMIGAMPMLLVLFPVTAGLIGGVLAVGYLRHRRKRKRNAAHRGPPRAG